MPVPASRRRANDKYDARCDRITIKPLRPHGEAIRQAAQRAGESLQGYILRAVDARMQAEQADEQAEDG